MCTQSAGQRIAETRFMGAAFGCRDRVAVGVDEPVATEPGDGPFQRAVAALFFAFAGKCLAGDLEVAIELFGEIVLEAAGKMEDGFFRRVVLLADQFGCTIPADLYAAEQIRLGTSHAEQARRLEPGAFAEDLFVREEAGPGAAAVVNFSKILNRAVSHAARKTLPPQPAPASNLDFKMRRQRVDNRYADAMQSA